MQAIVYTQLIWNKPLIIEYFKFDESFMSILSCHY